jgi:hypothetical protein
MKMNKSNIFYLIFLLIINFGSTKLAKKPAECLSSDYNPFVWVKKNEREMLSKVETSTSTDRSKNDLTKNKVKINDAVDVHQLTKDEKSARKPSSSPIRQEETINDYFKNVDESNF